MVTRALRAWFVAHFLADVLFAVPLMLAPGATLELFGWRHGVDPIATRLVAAALLGIGIESLLGRGNGVEGYRAMLRLKVIWSHACVVGLLWSFWELGADTPPLGWVMVALYLGFGEVWLYYALKLR